MFNREKQIEHLAESMDQPPVVVSPYDAELFGHWWFEGPLFLEHFIRKATTEQDSFYLASPSDYLNLNQPLQLATPCSSSWGDKGYHEVWLNGDNDWIYRHLHRGAAKMTELAANHPEPSELERRALNQAAREILLAQASDWPFIITAGTMDNYARSRLKDHMIRFNRLHRQITTGNIDPTWLSALEEKDNIFPNINYQVFLPLHLTETLPLIEKTASL